VLIAGVMKASQVGVAWLNTGDAQLKLQPVLSLLMPRAEGGTLADAMDKVGLCLAADPASSGARHSTMSPGQLLKYHNCHWQQKLT